MCYKVSTASERKLRAYLDEHKIDVEVKPYQMYYHANVFAEPWVPVQLNTEPKVIQPAYWKLLPAFVPNAAAASKLHGTQNTRSETAFTNKLTGSYLEGHRALLWVDGFYESHTQVHYTPRGAKKETKHPYYIYMRNHEPFTMACVWAPWRDRETGEQRNTFSILTTGANELMGRIHNRGEDLRMPVIIQPEERERWLAPIGREEIQAMLHPLPDGLLAAHPVTTDINKKGVPDADTLQQVCDNGSTLVL